MSDSFTIFYNYDLVSLSNILYSMALSMLKCSNQYFIQDGSHMHVVKR